VKNLSSPAAVLTKLQLTLTDKSKSEDLPYFAALRRAVVSPQRMERYG
jgi:hypothetical protein